MRSQVCSQLQRSELRHYQKWTWALHCWHSQSPDFHVRSFDSSFLPAQSKCCERTLFDEGSHKILSDHVQRTFFKARKPNRSPFPKKHGRLEMENETDGGVHPVNNTSTPSTMTLRECKRDLTVINRSGVLQTRLEDPFRTLFSALPTPILAVQSSF